MDNSDFFHSMRERMIHEHLRGRDITDARVLEVMSSIPRHLFVPEEYHDQAYADGPLPIGNGQTISQPYIVALMTQMLILQGTETVLEIGTGSGYQSAVLSRLARKIYTVERFASLAEHAKKTFTRLGYDNIEITVGDGSLGLSTYAPYDAILVTAAAPDTPRILLDQLAEGGRLVIPVGRRWEQHLHLWKRVGDNFEEHSFIPVAFVPLRGKYGWDEAVWSE
jgi:protein-L-isoaspartate(D-aspartate) O-methyltransferase